MRRDRLTFAMIVGIPVMQLLLFGFAINSDPKHLPTAVAISDPGTFSNSIVAALANSSYFDIRMATNSPADARRMLAEGEVSFVVEIPANFCARHCPRRAALLAGRSRCDRSRRPPPTRWAPSAIS